MTQDSFSGKAFVVFFSKNWVFFIFRFLAFYFFTFCFISMIF